MTSGRASSKAFEKSNFTKILALAAWLTCLCSGDGISSFGFLATWQQHRFKRTEDWATKQTSASVVPKSDWKPKVFLEKGLLTMHILFSIIFSISLQRTDSRVIGRKAPLSRGLGIPNIYCTIQPNNCHCYDGLIFATLKSAVCGSAEWRHQDAYRVFCASRQSKVMTNCLHFILDGHR